MTFKQFDSFIKTTQHILSDRIPPLSSISTPNTVQTRQFDARVSRKIHNFCANITPLFLSLQSGVAFNIARRPCVAGLIARYMFRRVNTDSDCLINVVLGLSEHIQIAGENISTRKY